MAEHTQIVAGLQVAAECYVVVEVVAGLDVDVVCLAVVESILEVAADHHAVVEGT